MITATLPFSELTSQCLHMDQTKVWTDPAFQIDYTKESFFLEPSPMALLNDEKQTQLYPVSLSSGFSGFQTLPADRLSLSHEIPLQTVKPFYRTKPFLNPATHQTRKMEWGTPQDHLWTAGWSSLVIGALYYNLFVYGARPDASTWELMLASIPSQLVIGSVISSLMFEVWNNAVVQRYLKPFLSRTTNRWSLQKSVPTLAYTNALPSYEWSRFAYSLQTIHYRIEIELLMEELEEFEKMSSRRELTPEEVQQKKNYEQDLKRTQQLYGHKLKLFKQIRAGKSFASQPVEKAQTQLKENSFDARYLTFAASTGLTLGAFFLVSGIPDLTANTKIILSFIGVQTFFNSIVSLLWMTLLYQNVWDYVIKPRLSFVVNSIYHVTGLRLLPGLTHMLGMPHAEMTINIIEMISHMARTSTDKLIRKIYLLEQKDQLTQEESERLKLWSGLVRQAEVLMAEYEVALKNLNTREKFSL